MAFFFELLAMSCHSSTPLSFRHAGQLISARAFSRAATFIMLRCRYFLQLVLFGYEDLRARARPICRRRHQHERATASAACPNFVLRRHSISRHGHVTLTNAIAGEVHRRRARAPDFASGDVFSARLVLARSS